MSAAETRTALLRDSALANNRRLAEAVNAYRAPLVALREATDEIEVAQHATRLALAVEGIVKAAEDVMLDARKALAFWMGDTGCPAIRTDTHTASLTTPSPKLRVLDPQAVPAEFMAPQPPKPDMAKLQAAYDAGQRFPGVEKTNGSAPFITIRARK